MTAVSLLAPLLIAAAVTALATPLVGRFARSIGAVDQPDERKVNRRAGIPLLGGAAVALGFYVGLAVAILMSGADGAFRNHLEGLLLGGLLLVGLGVVDDRWPLDARPKLVIQLLAASLAIAYGFRIDHVTDPIWTRHWLLPVPVMWAASLLWIVGITNSMNLLDGLDGLATGVGLIITATLTWICYQADQPVGVAVGVSFMGALIGFLPFNFCPARIFLGDTGALLIGYTLALLALEGYRKLAVLTFVVPLLALAVPLMDTALSIYRRVRRNAPIMSPDRLHMHHRLLEFQGSHRSAVLSIYFLTACFCIIAVSFTNLEGTAALIFLVLVLVLTLRLLRNLGFFDVEEPESPSNEARGEETH